MKPHKMPRDLTPRAQVEWDRLAGDVKPTDASVLALYCEQIAQAESWQGEFDAATDDKVKQKAAMRIRDCCVQIKTLAVEFGLTPASRKRLAAVEKVTDELDDFLEGGK